ncbi:uncharacterized protein LOC111388274 [Olea europaea var. sylvestris]|uniref:uncharacterized protein LOC111388274 n=1 Tax=Olea europaea var. sylvestris TaxID=158386 RepID=UPI000C1D32FC|nr:uncharacterized protein LOC111388274 [Olea europaea var. sylvestris]
MVDAAAGGILMAKTTEAAYALLDDIATNSYQWPSEGSGVKKVAEFHEVDPITALAAQVASLTNQIVMLTTQGNQQKVDSVMSTSSSHQETEVANEQAQYVNSRNYNQRGSYQANHYHPGLRNHENLSYGNNRNTLQPPPGFNTQNSDGKPPLEDILGTFISETRSRFNKDKSRLDNIETHVSNMGATMKNLEVQIGQLATSMKSQQQGKFPSDTEVNPKEHCKAVILRNGKQVGESEPTEESNPTPDKEKEQKKKDSGSVTIPCTIGSSSFENALYDLGASINLMLLSVFKKLGLEKVKPTTVTLQLADRSLTYPRSIIEDVLVKVDKFIFPTDFVVLDIEEDQEIPLILGRPFLATGRALIDVQGGHLTLRVNQEEVRTGFIDSAVRDEKLYIEDPLEQCMMFSSTKDEISSFGEYAGNKDLVDCILALKSTPVENNLSQCEDIQQSEELDDKESSESSKIELKQLPDHLRYAFLGDNFAFPVIISSSLTRDEDD